MGIFSENPVGNLAIPGITVLVIFTSILLMVFLTFLVNYTKTGKAMCYVKLEDLKGTLELTFFSNAVSKYRDVLEEDNLVTIKGRINIRPGMPISAVGEAVFLWKDEEEKAAQKQKPKERLCLKFDTKNPDIYSKVKSSISSYPGQTQVVIKCASSGKVFVYQDTVRVNNYLVNELSGIIGNENIVVQ